MCNSIDLSAYGLNGRFAALAAEYPGLTAARVVAQEKGRYDLLSAWGEAPGAVSGRFRHAVQTVSEFPAVGDFVMTDWNPDGEAVIRHVLPRKSCLLRRAADSSGWLAAKEKKFKEISKINKANRSRSNGK